MHTRTIPSSGEAIPVIGLGTWQTFDVGTTEQERAPLREVLARFHAQGGRVVDSSPMYGRSEGVVGDFAHQLGLGFFLATKVWTSGADAGERQMATSMTRMRTQRMDLLQVHNLVDVDTHLKTLRRWKDAGKVRYLGITHYVPSAFDALERLVRREKLDFVQLPYSLATREAEARLLPACAERGVAVLVNRPFEEGALFSRFKGREVPAWLREAGSRRGRRCCSGSSSRIPPSPASSLRPRRCAISRTTWPRG